MKYPPFTVLDGNHATDRQRTYTVTSPEPKAAMTISLETGMSLPDTVTQLHQLHVRGIVKSKTDEAGVIRWSRTDSPWYEEPPF
jgi:predicted Rossmann fold nucleotide-binding protein DprA/Smf involved in DNA uptake